MSRLIPKHAEEALREQDEARAKARENATGANFRRSFVSSFADQIEMIRRGAIITETDKEGQPIAFAMPDKKPVPTLAQARRTIWLSRVSRPFRAFDRWLLSLWRRLWTR